MYFDLKKTKVWVQKNKKSQKFTSLYRFLHIDEIKQIHHLR